MNIFQKENADLFLGDIRKKLGRIMESEITDLLCISENTLQMWTGGIIQSDQMPDEMCIQIGVIFIPDVAEDATL